MTSAEIMRMLETFRQKYSPEVAVLDPEVVRIWKDQFLQAHRDDMLPAVKDFLAASPASEGFPKPARVRQFLRARQEAATGHTEPSPGKPAAPPPHRCDRGWAESTLTETAVASRPAKDPRTGRLDGPDEAYTLTYPPGVYPCKQCNPNGFDRWHDRWIPEAHRMRPVRSTDMFTFNPVDKLAEARALNAPALATLTRDATDLTGPDQTD